MTQAMAGIASRFKKLAAKIKYKSKKLSERFMAMPLKKRVLFVVGILLTIALAIAIPVAAWFSSERKAAELYKVKYPNSLYLNAAHHEDQASFELNGINIDGYATTKDGELVRDDDNNIVKVKKKLCVFSVSGDSTSEYVLQLAHTTNNDFTYTIYSVSKQTDKAADVYNLTEGEDYVKFDKDKDRYTENTLQFSSDIDKNTSEGTLYYIKGDEITGDGYKNQDTDDKAKNNDNFYNENYEDGESVQEDAIPLYWQATETLTTQETANKVFIRYYILEITWTENTTATEETDLIYLSAERTK